MYVDYDIRRKLFFGAWFIINEMTNVCLERMSVVHIIVQVSINEEIYTGHLEEFFYDDVCSSFHM